MATRCPDCRFPLPIPKDGSGDGPRLFRCMKCGSVWQPRDLARSGQDVPGYMPAVLREAPISEGIVIEHIGPGFAEASPPQEPLGPKPSPRRRPFGRYGLHSLAGLALATAVLLGAVTIRVGAVTGLGDFAGLGLGGRGLVFTSVESRTVRIHGQSSLFVAGELANQTAGELSVPAIRVSLHARDGAEVYSWVVEPSTTRLAAGQSIGFRSVLGSTPSGATAVTLSFDQRQQIGMR